MRTKYKTASLSKNRKTTFRCGGYSFRGKEGLDQTTKSQCQIPGTADNPARKTRRKTSGCTEKVLSPVHTVTVRADERDICEDEGNRKERKMSEDGGPRRRGELFSSVSRRGRPSSGERNRQKKRACEANASSERSFDHLGNEMPGIGKV